MSFYTMETYTTTLLFGEYIRYLLIYATRPLTNSHLFAINLTATGSKKNQTKVRGKKQWRAQTTSTYTVTCW